MQQTCTLQLPVSSPEAGLEWEILHQQGVMQVCVETTEPGLTAVNLSHKPSVFAHRSVPIYTSFPTKPPHLSNTQASAKILKSRPHQKTDYFFLTEDTMLLYVK